MSDRRQGAQGVWIPLWAAQNLVKNGLVKKSSVRVTDAIVAIARALDQDTEPEPAVVSEPAPSNVVVLFEKNTVTK